MPGPKEQVTPIDDPRGPMGVRFFAQRSGESPSRAKVPTLVFSTNAGALSIVASVASEETHLVDSTSLLVLPARATAILTTRSPITHVFALSIAAELQEKVVATYAGEVDPAKLARTLSSLALLPRTNWMNEIVHRYLFERCVCRKHDTDATRFLETEIVKEVYFLVKSRDESAQRKSVVELDGPLLARALREIEAHLFEGDVLTRLPKATRASESSLLRAFKRELGRAPLVYVRERRLDEASLLLKSRRFSVTEVAEKVGYGNLAAFSTAFRARFGVQPSSLRGAVTSPRAR